MPRKKPEKPAELERAMETTLPPDARTDTYPSAPVPPAPLGPPASVLITATAKRDGGVWTARAQVAAAAAGVPGDPLEFTRGWLRSSVARAANVHPLRVDVREEPMDNNLEPPPDGSVTHEEAR